jgi:hypothetical protein
VGADRFWANDSLRLGIRILRGEVVHCRDDKAILQVVLVIKENLEAASFWWQAQRLDNHIHLWQKNHKESLQP